MHLHLPNLHVTLLTVSTNVRRHGRIGRFFAVHGYRDVAWVFGRPTTPHHIGARESAAATLREIQCPTLWLEDDAMPTADYRDEIDVPDDAQVVYLGGGRYGQSGGVTRTADWQQVEGGMAGLMDQPFPQLRTLYRDTDDPTWVQILSMSTGHAILWLDNAACRELADRIEADRIDYDHTLALNQWRYRVYGVRRPWFWQDDGHHEHTKQYFTSAG
jgi:hypothetical protein